MSVAFLVLGGAGTAALSTPLSPLGAATPPLIDRVAPEDGSAAGAGPGQTAADAAVPAVDMGQALEALASLKPEGWVSGPVQLVNVAGEESVSSFDRQALEILREFRCRGVASRFFQRGQRLVVAYLDRFENAAGAYGYYTAMREGASAGVKRGDASSEDDRSVSIWQGDYFIKVYTTAEDDDEAKELVLSVADALARGVKERAEKPELIQRLPRLDRVLGTERFLMGPVAARRFAHLPFLNDLSLESSRGAASADYQFREPSRERLKLLIVDYGDPQIAVRTYRQYIEALSDASQGSESNGSALFKLSGSYLWCRLQGQQVIVISGARKKYSAQILARQLNF